MIKYKHKTLGYTAIKNNSSEKYEVDRHTGIKGISYVDADLIENGSDWKKIEEMEIVKAIPNKPNSPYIQIFNPTFEMTHIINRIQEGKIYEYYMTQTAINGLRGGADNMTAYTRDCNGSPNKIYIIEGANK